MSTGKLMVAAVALGLPLGVVGAVAGWSNATSQAAIAVVTAVAVIGFIWLPDALKDAGER